MKKGKSKGLTLESALSRCVEEGNCLIWSQGTNADDRPMAYINGRMVGVQRWVLEQYLGRELRTGYCCSPRCGNTRCLSRLCLTEVTKSEAMKRHYKRTPSKSVSKSQGLREALMNRGWTVLDMEKARAIRARRDEGGEKLAAEFGVSVAHIYRIWRGKNWGEAASNSVFNWRPAA